MKNSKLVNDEKGFALVGAMLILIVVTILGLSLSTTTSLEHLIATNDRVEKNDFYNQESCLADAHVAYRTWMSDTFISAGETVAFFPEAGQDRDGNGTLDTTDAQCVDNNSVQVGSFMVRKIEGTGTDIVTWADMASVGNVAANHPANAFPNMDHIDKPDADTGYGASKFEFRRFAITSYSSDQDRNTILQEGVFKAFNKF